MRTIIIGLGNKLFGDDGAGIIAAERIKELINENTSINVITSSLGGLRLVDLLTGYDKAIVIDSIITGQNNIGYIKKWKYDELINSIRMISFHDVNFATAVEFARQITIPMPEEIEVFTIEVSKVENFSEILSNEVDKAVNKCVNKILFEVNNRHAQIGTNDENILKQRKIKC